MADFSSAITSHPIFTHSKENKGPQMSPAHDGRSLFYPFAYPCCLPLHLAAQLARHSFLLWAQECTSMHIHQLPWPLPEPLCHLHCCPWHFLSPAGLGSLFSFITCGTKKKRKLSLTPPEWEAGWSVRHSFSNMSFVLWGSLSPGHMWEGWSEQYCGVSTGSRWWPSHATSLRLGAMRVTQTSSRVQETWTNYFLSRTHTFLFPPQVLKRFF